MRPYPARSLTIAVAAVALLAGSAGADEPKRAATTAPSDRPMRYRPVDHGFAITNGRESFNRPLYGGYTAFRVDAGDRPEFSLYLPGRGGVLRVGLATADGARWLRDAATVEARYADAAMSYAIHDPAFGGATIRLTAVALRDSEGFAVRVEADGLTAPADVLFAFGGTNGEKAKRDGDIGTEPLPVGQYFALRPEHCRDNVVDLDDAGFTLRSKAERIAGVATGGAATPAVVDARQWDDADALRRSAGGKPDAPAALVTVRLTPGKAATLVLQHPAPDRAATAASQPTTRAAAIAPEDVDGLFDRAVAQNRAVARRVVVDTPDPYVDSAVSALCVAADALWDEKASSFMHGGVAWRRRYLGWRGPYAGDESGAHERTRQHLDGYFSQQNTKPVDESAPKGADASENLARSEGMLHSNGDLTGTHYDMNLVAVDAFFRHLLWTGDLKYAAANWPVIERHLAWERRLFRRPFGPDALPLYEAYAAIWASDDLQYGGGGVTHASAYNYYHNAMAARVAALLGKDPAPYQREADDIRKAMQSNLWLADRGWYAEFKDLLGRQLVHPDAGLWTYYHTIDSQVPDALEAWQMCRAIDGQIPHLPMRGPGMPSGRFATLSTTDWMPYTWSINNVVMAEVTHTALAEWQAGRDAQAMATWKAAVLDSMYLGLCPGNLHMTSAFDAYRAESQRDFGDPTGITWRATVEGLFGITPDALAGELTICPGFPADWDHASIEHPDLSYAFKRDGTRTTFKVTSRFATPMRLKLRVPAERTNATVTVNGQPAKWTNVDDAVGRPEIAIAADAGASWDVTIDWSGDAPATKTDAPEVAAQGESLTIHAPAAIAELRDPQGVLKDAKTTGDTLAGTVAGLPGDRTLFLKLYQAGLTWWQPVEVAVRPPVEVENVRTDSSSLAFSLRKGTSGPLGQPTAIVDASGAEHPVQAVGGNSSSTLPFRADGVALAPGANRFALRIAGQPDVPFAATDWSIKLPADAKLDAVDLASHFNDLVTQIFKNKYVSPRSPYASLSIPIQGFGGWATNKTTPAIDDGGLRALGGTLTLPCGVTFRTPSEPEAKNVLFVSQWDNYPREADVPLTGRAGGAYLLMAGSTNAMQSRLDNGEVVVTYADGGTERLPLRNPETWWPIEQDYLVDGHAFPLAAPMPPRVNLKTGVVRMPSAQRLSESPRSIAGGAATVLSLPLNPRRELKSLTVRSLANEAVIGLMGVTLRRP